MIATLLDRIVTGYGTLLAVAGAGLVLANVAGFVALAFQAGTQEAPDTAVIQTWMHGGWVVGVCGTLWGIVTKKRKHAALGEDGGERDEKRQRRRHRTPRKVRRYGRLASTALGGLGGALLGGMLGGSFLILWFSITYSPFAPREWVSSLSVERQRAGSSVTTTTTTNHPVAQIAFGAPLLLGALAGAVLGGFTGVTEEK